MMPEHPETIYCYCLRCRTARLAKNRSRSKAARIERTAAQMRAENAKYIKIREAALASWRRRKETLASAGQ